MFSFLRLFYYFLSCAHCTVMSKESEEQREFMRAIEDLCREIRNHIRGLKETVQYTNHTCDEVKTIGLDIG